MLAQGDANSMTRMSPSECRACADVCATLADLGKTDEERFGYDALANLWEYLAQEMTTMSANNRQTLLAITTQIDRAMQSAFTTEDVVSHVPTAPQGTRPRQLAVRAA